jgi:hypothetical protein
MREMKKTGGGVRMYKNFIFLIFLCFSSSVFSQSINDRLDEIQDELDHQRMMNKLNKGLEDLRKQNDELQRQQPQINPPIHSSPKVVPIPKVSPDFQYVKRIQTDDITGDVFIIKSSIRKQSNDVVNYKTASIYVFPILFDGKRSFKTDYIVETKGINCKNNSYRLYRGEFYLRDCFSCSTKKIQYSTESTMTGFVYFTNTSKESSESTFLCR